MQMQTRSNQIFVNFATSELVCKFVVHLVCWTMMWLLVVFSCALVSFVTSFNTGNFIHKPWGCVPKGFELPTAPDGKPLKRRPRKPSKPIVVQSVDELKSVFRKGHRIQDMDVRGDVAGLLQEPTVHPVVKALYDRKQKESQPGNRAPSDFAKIAVAIEGGGMRGCVAAGMITVR